MDQSSFEKIKQEWNSILNYIKEEFDIAPVSFNIFIAPLVPISLDKNEDGDQVLSLLVPNSKEMPDDIFRKVVSNRYSPLIAVAIEVITGIKCSIGYITESEKTNAAGSEVQVRRTPKQVDMSTLANANLNARYTFETFVVGKNNNLAHAASLAVAEKPGEIYNPLFIYGGVGLGKTHLMQSVAHFILQNNPKARILYVTSETFTNELIDSIRNKNNYSTTEFRKKYRNIDVLLIDDIQFIIGKESTQEEFFHTFNALYEAKKQIIISSDKPPKDFETLEDRLKSRFEWGLTVDIQPPDYETRMAILRKKEELDHINIDNEVIQYIAANVKSNIRELEGSLTKIVAMSNLTKQEINLEMAQEVLRDLINPDEKQEITPQFIIDVVADHFNVSVADLTGSKRNKEIVFPRQIAMYLCREMTNAPLQQIGSYLKKDHTTIIHGIDKISTEIQSKAETENTVSILKKKISAQ